jgi:hypothetical protein
LVKKKLPNTFFDSIVNLFGKKHEKESPPSRHNLRPRIEKARSEGTPATAAKTPQRKRLPPQRKKQKRLARRIKICYLTNMNTQIACLLRGVIWIGHAALFHYYKEKPISILELVAILGAWEFIIASCPFLKTK